MRLLPVLAFTLVPFISSAELKFEGSRFEVYKIASNTDLRLHIFEPEGHDPKKDKRPAIVFFFGGGWNGGTPAQFEQHSRYLASRGMKWIQQYEVGGEKAEALVYYLTESHRIVSLGLTKKKQKELGLNQD